MTVARRWVIPDPDEELATGADWERIHDAGYEEVFSVGEDVALRRRVVDISLTAGGGRLLLVGCGSRTHVQRELLERGPDSLEIVAADFESVVAIASSDFTHSRLAYVSLADLNVRAGDFDCVVAVNVAVSGSDGENRSMIEEWSLLLKDGGRLVSVMPIFSCGLEWAQLTGRSDIAGRLILERSSWYEEAQRISQVEYLPLRLRRVLIEADLVLERLEIVFLEDAHSHRELERVYGLTDPDIFVYEQIAVAVRRGGAAAL